MNDLQYVLSDIKSHPDDLTPEQVKMYHDWNAAHKDALRGSDGLHRVVGRISLAPMPDDAGIMLTDGNGFCEIRYEDIEELAGDLLAIQKLLKPETGKMARTIYKAEKSAAMRDAALHRR